MPTSKNGRDSGRDPDGPDPAIPDLITEDTLGGRISFAREIAGLSATQAAQRLGVMPQSWNAWERDRDVPRANRLANMAGILGVSLSWLLSGEGDGPREPEPDQDPAQLLRDLRSASLEVAALNRRMESIAADLEQIEDAPASPSTTAHR